ncbi:Clan CA, family C19, ubiquitin hydrolase-like cysteine peptidase [Trichomonas vaginalis G3]|uniref:Clan CA, family C19, ubiquitin hydrolase-like cysteine peptidase n=1 Tax=Trichomonas vaginalis (strain ATCC PRA-98 / G3) TaxID=412133 RepID=A2EZM1_TRIV3|nr:ubiquitinyl hydrolase protein [Trichomonas vaginalis G3]EAY01929.1 Clan CA, family C19, ubiquitin hydrolase-like cysteine peptidase [Trichomonas vaginalis G3]KAI5485299.1 ubiquitinyl hydrolase protein [Trichomonas vaginalis G3]|eukprot:XP_001330447.1 Clan CA, family C19, ubiquitin hydrolase-like cysteine peptidase [Trichomonas vaginalis G3]
MLVPPSQDFLLSGLENLGGTNGVESQIRQFFTFLLDKKEYVESHEIQNWFSADFSYFLRKLKAIRSENTENYQCSVSIYNSFLSFIRDYGIRPNFLKIISNFFDKQNFLNIAAFEFDNPLPNDECLNDIENVLQTSYQKDERNSIQFILLLFSTHVIHAIIKYVQEDEGNDSSLIHYIKIIRVIFPFVSKTINSYLITTTYKLIFDKKLKANSNFLQILEFIEQFSVFKVVSAEDIIVYLFKILETNYSYAGEIITKVLVFYSQSNNEEILLEIQKQIQNSLLSTSNPMVFVSVHSLMKKYKPTRLFTMDLIPKLISDTRVEDVNVKTSIIKRAIKYYEFNQTDIANEMIKSHFHSSKLEIYLIEKVDKSIAAELFKLFLENATNEELIEIKYSDKNNVLESLIISSFETVSGPQLQILIRLMTIAKLNGPICTFIERSYQSGKNYQLADNFKPLLSNIKERTTFKLLFGIVCDHMTSGEDNEILHYAAFFLRDWILAGEPSWLSKIIEPLFMLENIKITDAIPSFLDAIFERIPQHTRTLNFLFKLIEQTVPQKYCFWLIDSVMRELRQDRTNSREIGMFMDILLELLENPATRTCAIDMLYYTSCINADSKENNCCGVVKDLVFEHREKLLNTKIIINQWHTCNRIFLTVSRLYPVLKHYNITVDMPNGKEKTLNQKEPIFALPISENSEIRMRISNNDRTENTQKPPEMTSASIAMIASLFETNYQILEKYAKENYKIQCILVMMGLSERFFSENTISSQSNLIYPYYINYLVNNKPNELDLTHVLELLGDNYFDPIAAATISQSLLSFKSKVQISLSLFKKLIFNDYQCVRELTGSIVDYSNMQDVLVGMIHETWKPPFREKSEEFYEILSTFDIPNLIFAENIKDLDPYEDGSNFDTAFVGLLTNLDPSENNFELIYQKVFSRPVSDIQRCPFIVSQFARNAAYEWLLKEENREFFVNKLFLIPFIKEEEQTTLAYTGHSGIKNIGATCYVSVLIQCMNTMHRFVEKLFLNSDIEKMSPFVQKLRKLLASSRFIRGKTIDPSEMLYEIKDFSAQTQQDAVETYSSFINKIDEFDKTILDPITGKIERTNMSGDVTIAVKEEPFYYLSIRTRSVTSLQDGLKRAFTPEIIPNYHMSNGEIGVMKTRFFVSKWPMYLPFVLQRYEFDKNLGSRIKLTHRIEFPIILRCDEIEKITGSRPPEDYELCGVIVHSGTAQSGHYIALVNSNNVWYECNDGDIFEIDITKISELAFGTNDPTERKGETDVVSKTAYMLFYRQRTEEAMNNRVGVEDLLTKQIEEEIDKNWSNFIYNSSDLCSMIYDKFKENAQDENINILFFTTIFKIYSSKPSIASSRLNRIPTDDLTVNSFFKFIDKVINVHMMDIFDTPVSENFSRLITTFLQKESDISHYSIIVKYWTMKSHDDKNVTFILKMMKKMLEIEDTDWTPFYESLVNCIRILSDLVKNDKHRTTSLYPKTCLSLINVLTNNMDNQTIVRVLCELSMQEIFLVILKLVKKEDQLSLFVKEIIDKYPEILIGIPLPEFVYKIIEESIKLEDIQNYNSELKEICPSCYDGIILRANRCLHENMLNTTNYKEGLLKLSARALLLMDKKQKPMTAQQNIYKPVNNYQPPPPQNNQQNYQIQMMNSVQYQQALQQQQQMYQQQLLFNPQIRQMLMQNAQQNQQSQLIQQQQKMLSQMQMYQQQQQQLMNQQQMMNKNEENLQMKGYVIDEFPSEKPFSVEMSTNLEIFKPVKNVKISTPNCQLPENYEAGNYSADGSPIAIEPAPALC